MSEQLSWRCTWCGEEIASDKVLSGGDYYWHINFEDCELDLCGPVVEVKPSTREECCTTVVGRSVYENWVRLALERRECLAETLLK